MFLSTLAIGEKFVKTVFEKKDEHGLVTNDLRGKTGNRSFPTESIEEVKAHIKQFPVVDSHYVRSTVKRSANICKLAP